MFRSNLQEVLGNAYFHVFDDQPLVLAYNTYDGWTFYFLKYVDIYITNSIKPEMILYETKAPILLNGLTPMSLEILEYWMHLQDTDES